ncbi:amino acid ABC transporter permease [Yinghuangia soli]|uniref:Amino acid ABC transporter permease n=1 Tax=Yinghuangia soli TaxID=2908204 RepID=A0AA41Q0G3_9ACTN|nr:amino acid ABC transporter permease [Yinghuangia soli]MCF2528501.1 amino acid ABC transporter permease [Yinghuangia soli]
MTPPIDKGPAGGTPAGPAGHDAIPVAAGPVPIKAIPVRHYGRWISAVIVLAVVGLIGLAFSDAKVNWDVTFDYLDDDLILKGAWNTVKITVLSMLLGLALGTLAAVMRVSRNPVMQTVSWFYIWFFRGTPVYVQLVIWYNLALIFPNFNVGFYEEPMVTFMTPFLAALLGLGINQGAYMAEIIRAGIQSVDEGQTEASHALGMSRAKTMQRVVLPQAMRVIIPPTGNQFIDLLKTSSLVSAVQYSELFFNQGVRSQDSLATAELLFTASIWYLALTTVFSIGQYYLERHYAKGSQRSLPATPFQRVRQLVFSLRRSEVPRS